MPMKIPTLFSALAVSALVMVFTGSLVAADTKHAPGRFCGGLNITH